MSDEDVTEANVEPAVDLKHEPEQLQWLEPIFREHSKSVIQAAYRVTGNAEDAEDVLQTVFMRMARRRQIPDFSKGAGPYLRRAATNAALDLLRSRKARPSTTLEAVPHLAVAEASAAPDRQHLGQQLHDRLREALGILNQRNAEMFVMRYFEELDNRQIAALFDTTPGTVAVTLHRVRTRLEEEMRPYLGGVQ